MRCFSVEGGWVGGECVLSRGSGVSVCNGGYDKASLVQSKLLTNNWFSERLGMFPTRTEGWGSHSF